MRNNKEKSRDYLIDEYKIACTQVERLENTIWNSASIVGIGNIASFLISVNIDTNHNFITFLEIGFLSTALTWVWWNIIKRWWDIQHTIILRMRHIEKRTKLRIDTYIGIRDDTVDPWLFDITKKELGESDFAELLMHDPKFKKRGVRKATRFIPYTVTFTWVSFLFFIIAQKGGISMNDVKDLILQIFTYVGFIGIGFGIGILVGGARRKAIFEDAYKMLEDKLKKSENK